MGLRDMTLSSLYVRQGQEYVEKYSAERISLVEYADGYKNVMVS